MSKILFLFTNIRLVAIFPVSVHLKVRLIGCLTILTLVSSFQQIVKQQNPQRLLGGERNIIVLVLINKTE